jgi:hypothetical protein
MTTTHTDLLPANPQIVSRTLREAGLSKAGRYTSFGGYVGPGGVPQDGYKVNKSTTWVHTPGKGPRIGTDVHVRTWIFTSYHGRQGHEYIAQVRQILEAAGYVVTFHGREARPGIDSIPSTLAVWKP